MSKRATLKRKVSLALKSWIEQQLLEIDLGKDFSVDHTLLFQGWKQRAGFSTDERMTLSEMEIYPNLRQEDGPQRLFRTPARHNVQWNLRDSKEKLPILILDLFFAIDL